MRLIPDVASERFLADLDRIDERQARVERALSSGYRVNKASDAPSAVIDILQLRSDIGRATNTNTNLDRVSAEVDSAEAAVRLVVQLVERARTLAAQTATETATNRPGIALEVKEIHQQLVDIMKTVSEGRYVFSGDSDQTPLYSADWTLPGGIVSLVTAPNTRRIEDVNGSSFAVGKTASELLDTRDSLGGFAVDNVFNAVYTLGKELEADNRAGVEGAAVLINKSLEHLSRQLTFYGNTQNRIDNATTLTETVLIARRKELSELQDTDFPEALTELSYVKVHREAALGAHAQMNRSSLFDYLG